MKVAAEAMKRSGSAVINISSVFGTSRGFGISTALAGATPREAAAYPTRRPDLLRLLDTYDVSNQRASSAWTPHDSDRHSA